jgi:hypothetical protein
VRHRRGVTVTDEPDPHLTVHDAALREFRHRPDEWWDAEPCGRLR